jgi:phage-related protein
MAAQRSSDIRPKPVRWIGSSKDDLKNFPKAVRWRVGGALRDAQIGRNAPYAKPLKGFRGVGVLEIVDECDGATYRAVSTVRLAKVVYVLHEFQKKSKRGIAGPKVSAVVNGRLANESSADLMRILTALGQDIEIVVKAMPRNRRHGRIRVVDERASRGHSLP